MPTFFSFDETHQFVAGLDWIPVDWDVSREGSSLFRRPSEKTLRMADQMQADLVAWRKVDTPQIAFTHTDHGVKPGTYSIAMAVADHLTKSEGLRSFLYAAEIPDGRWIYLAQQEGVILPDSDLCDSDDVIRSRMLGDRSIGTWDAIFAPDHWGISQAQESHLAHLLPTKKNKQIQYREEWALKTLNPSRKGLYLGLVGVSFLAAGGYFIHAKIEADRLAEIERARILAEQAANSLQPPAFVPPWHSLPSPTELTHRCMSRFYNTPWLNPVGWDLGSAKCNAGGLILSWQRAPGGQLTHLLELQPNVDLSINGEAASIVLPYEGGAMPTPQEGLDSSRARQIALHSAAQKYGFSITITPIDPPPQVPGQPRDPALDPPWNELKWEISNGNVPIGEIIDIINGPGLRVDEIDIFFNKTSISWTLKGKQYVSRE